MKFLGILQAEILRCVRNVKPEGWRQSYWQIQVNRKIGIRSLILKKQINQYDTEIGRL